MIIGKISAQNSAFGLKFGTDLQRDLDSSRAKILAHVNADSLNAYFKENVNYLKSTLPNGHLDLVHINNENGGKTYILSDENGKSTPVSINDHDLCYGRLKRAIKKLRCGEFRQKAAKVK